MMKFSLPISSSFRAALLVSTTLACSSNRSLDLLETAVYRTHSFDDVAGMGCFALKLKLTKTRSESDEEEDDDIEMPIEFATEMRMPIEFATKVAKANLVQPLKKVSTVPPVSAEEVDTATSYYTTDTEEDEESVNEVGDHADLLTKDEIKELQQAGFFSEDQTKLY